MEHAPSVDTLQAEAPVPVALVSEKPASALNELIAVVPTLKLVCESETKPDFTVPSPAGGVLSSGLSPGFASSPGFGVSVPAGGFVPAAVGSFCACSMVHAAEARRRESAASFFMQ